MAQRHNLTLERLTELPASELATEWTRRFGAPRPKLSPDLLRLGIGYKLQEERQGGLSRSTRALMRQLDAPAKAGQVAKPPPRKLGAGTVLVRDWHGVGYKVTVLDDGFEFDGKHWKSLTAIAKAITGTHWNGPKFFGLTGRKS